MRAGDVLSVARFLRADDPTIRHPRTSASKMSSPPAIPCHATICMVGRVCRGDGWTDGWRDGWPDGTMALDRAANGSRRARQKRRRAHTRARVRTNPIKIICTVVYRSAPAQALNMVCACSGNNPRLLRHRLSPAQASNGRLIDDSNGRPIDWLVGRPIRRPIRRRGGVVVGWCGGVVVCWHVVARCGA